MGFRRRRVGALVIAAVAFVLVAAPSPGAAASLDTCAQRVIRDWYSGARVDHVYPLACYRAAIRALPDDVLQYSSADQDIRRALAFARRGRSDPGNRATGLAEAEPAGDETTRSRPTTGPAAIANEAASPVSQAPVAAETSSSATSVPYPILALAGLAGVLLVAGGVGWLAGRRR